MPSPFTRASWIWPDLHYWDIHNGFALFRKRFDLPAVPAVAPLFITADQSYRLYVNGRFIGRGPARGFQAAWPYDEIDLAPFLHVGTNLIAVRAYHPGRSTFQYTTQGFAGLLVAAQWGDFSLVSDASWKSIRQHSTRRDTVQSSLQLFDQEHIDLRQESGDWTSLDFADEAWSVPSQHAWNGAPWFNLESRNIPALDERTFAPVAVLGTHAGTSASGYAAVRDVVALRMREDRSHSPGHRDFTPLHVEACGRGEFRSYLFDFGRTVVGNLVFTVRGAAGDEIIDTHLGETLDTATLTIDQAANAHSRMAFGDRLICRPGDQHHRFHHHYGFRYLEVTVREATRDFHFDVALDWIGYPLGRAGAFESSDRQLVKIWEACAWTQRCCSLDAYVDTPWREQAQWWGDARVQAWNTFHLSGDARLFRRGIAQIAAQTTPDGLTYGHAPTVAHTCILPDFTVIWLLTLWDYYWQTGSTEPLLTHRDTIRRALTYFEKHTNPSTGLVEYDARFWLFLDWTDLFKDGAPAIYNLWLLLALQKLAELHRIAGLTDEAAPLDAWADRLSSALSRLVNTDGLMRDGMDRAGNIVADTSLHAQVLALAAGVKGVDVHATDTRLLLPFIREEFTPKAYPSAYWITYIFSALAERGHGAAVVAFIRKHWAAMADYGTTWENFAPKRGDESHSHAWSAHPLFHLMQTIGGVVQTAPAWREISFRPVFVGDHARTVVPTPHGPITAEWQRTSAALIDVRLDLPLGIRAQVHLPGNAPASVSGGFRATVHQSS